jgi:anti-sigma regulatory factor (Ser/Thr protein kinase)
VTNWSLPLSDDTVADLKLCTTEVVGNALKHADGECWVTVSWLGSHLRVDVRDRSHRPPRVGKPNASAQSGRGLLLVKALAQALGWEPSPSGKTVFFLIAQDAAADAQQCGQAATPASSNATSPLVPA